MAENVVYAPFETTTAGPAEHSAAQPVSAEELSRLHDVPVELAVEVGRTKMTIREALPLGLLPRRGPSTCWSTVAHRRAKSS